MVATPPNALRRIAGFTFALMLFSLCLAGQALGQSSPSVIATAPTGLTHPTGWGPIWGTSIDTNGDWLVADYANGGLYEFPANGGAMITLVAPGGLSYGGGTGSYTAPFSFLDPGNNLYVSGSYSNCMVEFPYGSATAPWPGLSTLTPPNNYASNDCGSAPYSFADGYPYINFSPYYFQPWSVAIGQGPLADNLLIGSNNNAMIFAMPVSGAWSNPVPFGATHGYGESSGIISGMTKRPRAVATDPEGNVYFVEDSGGLSGVYEVPVSDIVVNNGGFALTSDAGLTRVDPNLPNVVSVVADAIGNLYVSDANEGVFFVPNPSGTPQTANTIQLSSVPAQGNIAVDPVHNILYVPTTQTQTNGQADVAKVITGYAELGSSAVGTATTTLIPVDFTFNTSVTPTNISIVEAGTSTPDFSIDSSSTCATGTAYASLTSCTENIVFTPQSAGNISAKLVMQSKSGTVASIILHGTGTGASYSSAPSAPSSIGSGLKTPSQVAVDAGGNIYVADAGLGQVLEFAAGSSTSVSIGGTSITAPTGVAVDGGGDVFIADSGNIYEIPYGPSGLASTKPTTLLTGLGSNLRLAADGLGNLYVADPSNKRVVEISNPGGAPTSILAQTVTFLTSGLTDPTAVAVDSSNTLYVIDGSNLFEDLNGTFTAALTSLSGATGLAIDPAGSVYLTSTAATVRIPVVSGALSTADETTIDATATNQASVAVDSKGNIYLAPTAGGSIAGISSSATLNFGNVPLSDIPSLDATITSTGNVPLAVTGYASSNSLDYTAADGTCVGSSPIAPGATCEADVTLSPGPGQQGTLTGQITLTSNAGTATVINATADSAALAPSTTTVSIGSGSQVISTQVIVTVTPQSGTGVPTGQVTVTYTTTTGATATATGTLSNGVATVTVAPVPAGTDSFSVSYQGDRAFAGSTASGSGIIAKSLAIIAGDPNPPSFLPYTLSSQDGTLPYNGDTVPWQYQWPVTVTSAAGQPTGSVTFMAGGAAACPQSDYVNGGVPGGPAYVTLSPTGQASFQSQCLDVTNSSITTYVPMSEAYTITVVYNGDSNYATTTGPSVNLIALRSPAVIITASPSSLSLAAGSSATTNITLTSIVGYGWAGAGATLNNYTLPVALTCTNLPPYSTCSYSYPNPDANTPNSVDIPCNNASTALEVVCTPGLATITINTNVPPNPTTGQVISRSPVTLALMLGFGLLGVVFRKRVGAYRNYLLALGVTMILFAATACSTKNLNPVSAAVTPKGTYTIGVTAIQVGYQVITNGSTSTTVYGTLNQVSVPFTMSVTVQ
jgi:hypothetical protein